MTVTVTYPRAGQIDPAYEEYVETLPANTGGGSAIAAGLIGSWDTGKIVVNPVGGGVRPYVGIVEAKGDNDAYVRALTYGIFYGYAEGNIPAGSVLMGASTTAGHMKAGVSGGGTPTAANLLIGDYMGHAGEGSGNSPITAATSGQIIKVFIR